jgi:acyl-coenzyme A synthetase/AMP-(fatty) acid ligase
MSLSQSLLTYGNPQDRFVRDAIECLPFSLLLGGSSLYGRGEELQGKSVLLVTKAQLTTAAALIELDGVARRIVLCPPDVRFEQLPYIIQAADIDGIVSDRDLSDLGHNGPLYFSPCTRGVTPRPTHERSQYKTEWVLLTSGTTGVPKLAVHTLESLCAAIHPDNGRYSNIVWGTFYDIRRYGGLQIFLRALLTGGSMVFCDSDDSPSTFLERAISSGVTHISGTPSHWRRAILSPEAARFQPRYIRLSGEAVDQAILNRLRDTYPSARIVHAFASTEAGVAFEVNDGLHGFPQEILNQDSGPELKIQDGTLRIRSDGAAKRYLGDNPPQIADDLGYVDTKDIIQFGEDRCYFCGRSDGVINVGGLKVFPEEVESVLNRHPEVHMCLIRARKSPITGDLIVADVVLNSAAGEPERNERKIQSEILRFCRATLPPHKVPAVINIVPALLISRAGKMVRSVA